MLTILYLSFPDLIYDGGRLAVHELGYLWGSAAVDAVVVRARLADGSMARGLLPGGLAVDVASVEG
jgi:hypothetical protein